MSDALVGYMMETGDDEMHLPPRPFLVPGVQDALPEVTKALRYAAQSAIEGRGGGVDAGFEAAGLAAVSSVQQKMMTGPFTPLSQSTIEARARRRYKDTGKLTKNQSSVDARSYLQMQAEGTPDFALADSGLAKPLLDTRSLFNAITYVVKDE